MILKKFSFLTLFACGEEVPLLTEAELSSLSSLGLTEDDLKKEPKSASMIRPRLDGILYIKDKQWIVWLNGEAIHSSHPLSGSYKIIQVTPNTVAIEWEEAQNKVIELKIAY